jgi:hypothetical protein
MLEIPLGTDANVQSKRGALLHLEIDRDKSTVKNMVRLSDLGEHDRRREARRRIAESTSNHLKKKGGNIMQTRTGIGFVAALIAGMAVLPTPAKAVCTLTIYAETAYSDGSTARVFGHVTAGDQFNYVAETTNALFANLIFAATASHNRLYITGSAQNCPTTGTFRDIGNILEIYQNP